MINAKLNGIQCYIAATRRTSSMEYEKENATKSIELILFFSFPSARDKEEITNNLNTSLQIEEKQIKVKILKMFIVNGALLEGIELHVRANKKDLVECAIF
jgi:hypothetical protein